MVKMKKETANLEEELYKETLKALLILVKMRNKKGEPMLGPGQLKIMLETIGEK